MEPALRRVRVDTLMKAAMRDGWKRVDMLGVSDCTTSWMSVRGYRESRSEGVSSVRNEVDSDFDSVPGTLDNGRSKTSNVAFDGCSALRRTSIGPDTDARALHSPNDHVIDESRDRVLCTHRIRNVPIRPLCLILHSG